MPRNAAKASFTRLSVVASKCPIQRRAFPRGTVVALSTMICDRSRSPVVGPGSTVTPKQRGLDQLTRQWQHGDRGVFSIRVRLYDQRRPWLAVVARHGDRHQIAAPHAVRPSVLDTSSIQRITSASSLLGSAARSAIRRDCRRASAPKARRWCRSTKDRMKSRNT